MTRSKIIETKEISFINDNHGEHTIENLENIPSWSLHRYY